MAYLPIGRSYRGTATMIGPSTALTAAHCVHNGTNWLTLPNVAPGTDATGAFGDNSKPNFGRRMTRDVFDFITAYSAL